MFIEEVLVAQNLLPRSVRVGTRRGRRCRQEFFSRRQFETRATGWNREDVAGGCFCNLQTPRSRRN